MDGTYLGMWIVLRSSILSTDKRLLRLHKNKKKYVDLPKNLVLQRRYINTTLEAA